jgi:polyhydroxyalkanoate synthase
MTATTAKIDHDHAEGAEVAGALDLLLGDAALGPFRRFVPLPSTARFARELVKHPRSVARRGADLGGELAKIAAGRSDIVPSSRDRRFADPAWTQNAFLRRLVQAYLMAGRTAEGLVTDVDLDWRDTERVQFLVSNLIEAGAPSNNPLINPLAWKALIDSGGSNVVRGVRHLLADMASAPRVPSTVDTTAFEVGRDLATTPGSVVLRAPMFELIQYNPQTETVRERPLLIVPPTINKFYILDLAAQRSVVEYLVNQGQQVFVISWRNPDARHSGWGFDAYGAAVLDALDAVEKISSVEQSLLLGVCSGGNLASMVMAYLAAGGRQDRVAGFGLWVTVLDEERAGVGAALLDQRTATAAIAASRARGYLDGAALAEVFAWLRPNDLVWNYWVNNYLQGKTPPAFDILYWNADTTRMTAALHRDFVTAGLHNALTVPGGVQLLDTDVDLSRVDVDCYVVAGVNDHICPWQACYRGTQLLGGDSRFVLSSNGHIAAMVNPPGNPKSSYLVSDKTPSDPAQWQAQATAERGTWWPDFDAWLADRAGDTRPAPKSVGTASYPPLEAAPGTYVFDS